MPKAPACPICGDPATPEAKPFCSPRCKDVDLNRWLSDGYAIPSVEEGLPGAAGGEADGEN